MCDVCESMGRAESNERLRAELAVARRERGYEIGERARLLVAVEALGDLQVDGKDLQHGDETDLQFLARLGRDVQRMAEERAEVVAALDEEGAASVEYLAEHRGPEYGTLAWRVRWLGEAIGARDVEIDRERGTVRELEAVAEDQATRLGDARRKEAEDERTITGLRAEVERLRTLTEAAEATSAAHRALDDTGAPPRGTLTLAERIRAAFNRPVSVDREGLGRLVRETWIARAREQPTPKPSWLVPWEGLDEPDREVDRRIGEAVVARVLPPLPEPAGEWKHYRGAGRSERVILARPNLYVPTFVRVVSDGDGVRVEVNGTMYAPDEARALAGAILAATGPAGVPPTSELLNRYPAGGAEEGDHPLWVARSWAETKCSHPDCVAMRDAERRAEEKYDRLVNDLGLQLADRASEVGRDVYTGAIWSALEEDQETAGKHALPTEEEQIALFAGDGDEGARKRWPHFAQVLAGANDADDLSTEEG